MRFDDLTAVKVSMLVCWVVTPCGIGRWVPTFRKNKLSPSSRLNMEAVCASETLVSTYKSTWRHNPGDEQGRPVNQEKFEQTTSRMQVWRVSVTSTCWVNKILNLLFLHNVSLRIISILFIQLINFQSGRSPTRSIFVSGMNIKANGIKKM
jgi:hypothetical protein